MRFLSYFQIFYNLKVYLQTHDVPKRIVQSCYPLYLKRPDWSTVYIKMLLFKGLPQRNGCIEVYYQVRHTRILLSNIDNTLSESS